MLFPGSHVNHLMLDQSLKTVLDRSDDFSKRQPLSQNELVTVCFN